LELPFMPGRWACGGLQISIAQSGTVVGIEHGAQLDRHRRADRGGGELVLARPLHPHGAPRMAHGDEGCVEGGVVGGVVAVGAGALAVEHGDLLGLKPERPRKPVTQHRWALGMRPDLERAIPIFGKRA
jgi:hypothetical protein